MALLPRDEQFKALRELSYRVTPEIQELQIKALTLTNHVMRTTAELDRQLTLAHWGTMAVLSRDLVRHTTLLYQTLDALREEINNAELAANRKTPKLTKFDYSR